MNGGKKEKKQFGTLSSGSPRSGEKDGGAPVFAGRWRQEARAQRTLRAAGAAENEPAAREHAESAPEHDFSARVEAAADRAAPVDYAEEMRRSKKAKREVKDTERLTADGWRTNKGHALTYAGIFLFTLVIYFRPYELIPALSGLNSIALVIALVTLLVYAPTQVSREGNLTTLTTEVKCVLALVFFTLLTIPIAKDPGLAWTKFSNDFSKVAIMFVIMVNVLRTRRQLQGLMWLSIGVGALLGYQAIDYYRQGVFKTEEYRVSVDFGGMFGNPNDMAMHLAIFTPIALTLAFASKNKLAKLVYFAAVALMVGGILVTQSRGGFLGLIGMMPVLAWKIGRNQRFKVMALSAVGGLFVIAFAPGNYGLRLLSIFVPALDPSGSSDQRRELLIQSVIVTLRNPWGIGMGNFPIVGIRNRETHNAFTQVSAELGVLALVAYLILLFAPWRKLGIIERKLYERKDYSWIYYVSIGLQASLVAYAVSSFFGAVAYNWFVYYPIAYAVCLRRLYRMSEERKEIKVEGFVGAGEWEKGVATA